MAMNPMQKKARTSFILGVVITLLLTGIVIALLLSFILKKTVFGRNIYCK